MKNDLISVVVVTYNSSETILETLLSIKAQTHKNIELIITDDCSKDKTILIVKKWISENKKRFENTKLITSPINNGVTKNCNKGFKSSRGEWIKIIAGDDILLPNCLEEYLKFALDNPEASFVFSKSRSFKVVKGKKVFFPENVSTSFFRKNSLSQYRKLLVMNYCSAPTSFIRASAIKKLGYFDESMPMIEDRPLWLKATKNGYKLYFIDKALVLYRLSNSSTQSSVAVYNPTFLANERDMKRKVIYPNVSKYNLFFYLGEFRDRLAQEIIIKLLGNKKNFLTNSIWYFFFALSWSRWQYLILPKIIPHLKRLFGRK